ncbi:hypothetical protein AB3N02_22050 [Priestia aryabhattai]|uniref:hypothetical protein n=1 Tax=Priestia aryabhattai TaxID=412384 RepID=UPI0039A341AE
MTQTENKVTELVEIRFASYYDKGYEVNTVEVEKETPKMFMLKSGFYRNIRKAIINTGATNYGTAYCYKGQENEIIRNYFSKQAISNEETAKEYQKHADEYKQFLKDFEDSLKK